jgi:hypothetical protein
MGIGDSIGDMGMGRDVQREDGGCATAGDA